MKRKLTELEYNQQTVESIISNKLSVNTVTKYKSHLMKFSKFLGCVDGPDVLEQLDISKLTEESISQWIQENLRKKDGKMKKASSMDIIRSSIVYFYNHKRVNIPENIEKTFSDFFTGFKRAEARGKMGGIVATKEGRLPFSESAYVQIAQLALTRFTNVGQVSENICYAILCWNLCARVQTAKNLNLGNMSWETDSLIVRFGMSKSDQTGFICKSCHSFYMSKFTYSYLCQPILSRD